MGEAVLNKAGLQAQDNNEHQEDQTNLQSQDTPRSGEADQTPASNKAVEEVKNEEDFNQAAAS